MTKISETMEALGFHIASTGGGCEAWEKILPDEGYVWITAGDGMAVEGDAACSDWIVGRYKGDFWLCVTGCTFEQAMSLIDRIPVPLDELSLSFAESERQADWHTVVRHVVRDIATQGCDFLVWGDGCEAAARQALQDALAEGLEVELVSMPADGMDEHTRRLVGG